MEDHDQNPINSEDNVELDEVELLARRDFLHSLMKWSSIVIGSVVLGAASGPIEAQAGWVNRRGSWVNGAGGGGWINRGGSWINGGGGWANRSGGGWLNGRGGGGSWVNRRG